MLQTILKENTGIVLCVVASVLILLTRTQLFLSLTAISIIVGAIASALFVFLYFLLKKDSEKAASFYRPGFFIFSFLAFLIALIITFHYLGLAYFTGR